MRENLPPVRITYQKKTNSYSGFSSECLKPYLKNQIGKTEKKENSSTLLTEMYIGIAIVENCMEVSKENENIHRMTISIQQSFFWIYTQRKEIATS